MRGRCALGHGPRRRSWLLGMLAIGASTVRAAEAPYPARPIALLVGSGPGSNADLLCRLLAYELQAALKQPVIVENRVGASGSIAALAVVRAKPDGYTLLFANASTTVVSQAAQPTPAFDPRTDLAAVCQIGVGGVPLVVTSAFPAGDMREFIAVVGGHPGKYQYAISGVATAGHLIMEWIKSRTGIRIEAVPYPSVPAIVQDMLGGVIEIGFLDSGSAAPFARSGRLKVLGISGSRRSPALPDVALMSEQGLPFEIDGWYGLFAPTSTPVAIVQLLNREVARLLAAPALRERLAQLNVADTPVKSPGEFARTVRDDFVVWRQLVQNNNIRLR